MFKNGRKATMGDLSLNFHTIQTDTGYVQMEDTTMYALSVSPPSKAMPANAAKANHGRSKTIQRRNNSSSY